MNVNSFLSPRMMMGAAIVGLVGAAGVFIYEKMCIDKQRALLVNDVARLNHQLACIKADLDALRDLQKETNMRRRSKRRVKREAGAPAGDATDSEYFTDCQSLIGTDMEMDSEEFYDVPSDDDDTLREPVPNGHVTVDQNTSDDKTASLKDSTKLK